jgi:insulysin
LTVEKLEAFIPQLISMLHVECLVHGNMDKESALNLVNLVEKKLAGNALPLLPQHLLRYRDMRLEDGKFLCGKLFSDILFVVNVFRLQLCV